MRERAVSNAVPHWRDAQWPALCLVAAAVPLMILQPDIIEALDERLYHLPAIHRFAAGFPRIDLAGSPVASGPLYHLLLALPARAGADGLVALRVMSLAFAAAGAVCVWWCFAALTTSRRAAWFASILVLSPYYLGPSLYLANDTMAFGCMAITLGVWLRRAGPTRPGTAAVAAAASMITRQIYAWLIPLCALDAWRRRVRGPALFWIAVPSLALAGLFAAWGGLVPPAFQFHTAPSGLLPLLVVLGTLGPWAAPLVPSFAEGADRRVALLVMLVAGAAAAGYLAWSPLGDAHPAPWGGGLRTLGRHVPSLYGTSLLYWAAIMLGVLTVALWVSRRATPAQRAMQIALGLWALAQTGNAAMHERYYHPFLLLALLALTAERDDRATRTGRIVLALMVAAATTLRLVVHGGGLYKF